LAVEALARRDRRRSIEDNLVGRAVAEAAQ
jgi:hypothetical protein